jgi:hypothetical protein
MQSAPPTQGAPPLISELQQLIKFQSAPPREGRFASSTDGSVPKESPPREEIGRRASRACPRCFNPGNILGQPLKPDLGGAREIELSECAVAAWLRRDHQMVRARPGDASGLIIQFARMITGGLRIHMR